MLNRILVGDCIWLARLQGQGAGIERLDVALYENFEVLRAAPDGEGIAINDYVRRLSKDDLASPISYRAFNGDPHADALHELLTHLSNHQTHHRGQAMIISRKPPSSRPVST